MTKVLHINSNYLTSKLHENLIDKLEILGIDNEIYMPIKKEKEKEFLYVSQHKIHHPAVFKDCDKLIFSYKQHKITKNLEKTIDYKQFSLTHAHTLFTDGNVARNMKKKYGVPYIVTVRGNTDINGFFKKRINLRQLGQKILKDASVIVFLSDTNRKELFSNYISHDKEELMKKSVVIPNGIDQFWFENEYYAKKYESSRKLKLLFVGKLTKEKNPVKIIDVMRVLKENYGIMSEVTFVGKTVDQKIKKTLKKVADVPVTLIDNVDQKELIHYYRKHDLFIMPSFTETFGLVYAEAMSQGLPVIYTINQGFDNQFPEGKVGYSVNPNNQQEIAKKINLILFRYNEISGNCIQSYRKFNWGNIANYYDKLYNSMIL